MKPERVSIFAAAAFGLIALAAFAQTLSEPKGTRPAIELERAITKEQVDGDLKAAVGAYQKIGADKAAPREVRAKALLQLAGCYERLGQQQAQKVYEQIVRDFGDQPVATAARTRLAAMKESDRVTAPATITQRKIEASYPHLGPGDTDGKRIVYMDRATGELIYGDVAGHSRRVIFKAGLDDLPGWGPSRDFSKVMLSFHRKQAGKTTLAVVNTDGSGYREFARLDRDTGCYAWSWDNRYALVCQYLPDGTNRLLKVSLSDGQVRELMHSRSEVYSAVFSPDGRYVAYAEYPVETAAVRICTLPADGGEPRVVYGESTRPAGPLRLLDWTADSRFLSMVSVRSGKSALQLLPMKDGAPAGEPVFVRYGDFSDGATTATGALVYYAVRPGGAYQVHLAPLDPNGGLGEWRKLDLSGGNKGSPWPAWSPDGSQVVYTASDDDVGRFAWAIRLRDIATGRDRELYRAAGAAACVWARQQQKVYCVELTDKADIFSIALESGGIEKLHSFPSRFAFPIQLSRDDGALYLLRFDGGQSLLVRWDIAAGRETIISASGPNDFPGLPSADERWLMRSVQNQLMIRPMSGGEWTPLTVTNRTLEMDIWSHGFGAQANITYDGNWLLYHDSDGSGREGLYRIATAGGRPERLGDFPTIARSGSLQITPDGRRVLAVSVNPGEQGYELWSLENFVPPAAKH